MKVTHQFQDFGSELLEQPRHCIWLEAETPEEANAVASLCTHIHGNGVKAGLTGYHALDAKGGRKDRSINDFPKTYIIYWGAKT